MRLFNTIFHALYDVFADAKVRGLLIFTFSLITLATLLFWRIEGWPLIDAAFFSVVTISTVGYGNLTPVTVAGKIICMIYILLGLGVFVASASSIAEALIKRRTANISRK